VDEEEIAALAATLGLDEAEFRERYTRRLRGGDISLIERDNYDCVFYDRNRGCTVYEQRPRQCRTWPFWRSLVLSPETWAEGAESCPGLNSGPLHTIEEIAEMVREDGTSGSGRRRRKTARSRGSAASRKRARSSRADRAAARAE
jgi:Fe-S-cluster containining protein